MAVPEVLKCVLCGREYKPEAERYTCDSCGLDGTLDVLYDTKEMKKNITRRSLKTNGEMTQWRYRDILPVINNENIPDLAVGWTPIYSNKKIAQRYGVREFYIKDDGRNPTSSLKDRASAVAIAKALDFGQDTVACASTGNAASSLSGFAAASGLKSWIFVPEKAPEAKVTQLMVYGANVVLVKGNYEDAFSLATEAIYEFGWYNRNCAINPYLVEGKKTCAIEIAEQLCWDVPDIVFISMGDGCCISGLYKGFRDMLELDLIDHMPRLVGVQAKGASPIFDAVKNNREHVIFGPADTIADSISVGAPRNWAKALRAIRASGGTSVSVTDNEILSAITELAQASGVFGEPAGVTGFAGFCNMARKGMIGKDERIAVVVTGSGLKDIANAKKSVSLPVICDPSIDDFIKACPL